ncbi:MAG: iron dependent repressor, metal binding and dimerization domain protein [Vicinamibacterales bacterium]
MTRTLVLVAVVLATWLVVRWRQRHSPGAIRRQHEDALKHLFDLEYRGRHGSIASIAGALRLSDRAVVGLVGRLQTLGLVRAHGQDFRLTAEGERVALQIVRAHRLLERYFADEARLPLKKIHAAAERGEHRLSPEDVDRLSARLGHPHVDPHGDPGSRCARGRLAPARPARRPRVARRHDGPHRAPRGRTGDPFAQIAAGLRVGMLVRLVESTPERLVLSDGEDGVQLCRRWRTTRFPGRRARGGGGRRRDPAVGSAERPAG